MEREMKYASLIKYLTDQLEQDGDCLGALVRTRIFCSDHLLDFEAIRADLTGHGVEADCEVILQVVGQALDAICRGCDRSPWSPQRCPLVPRALGLRTRRTHKRLRRGFYIGPGEIVGSGASVPP